MMAPLDALLGWDEDSTAEAYAAFTRDFPMYAATSRDLAGCAELTGGCLVVDLCGGTGATAAAILELVPIDAQVVSLDNAAAMQRVGRRTLADPRLTWVTAPAEDLADYVPGAADAVVCNSAIWKTDVPQVFAAVHQVLRPGGRFVFNVGGGFAGVRLWGTNIRSAVWWGRRRFRGPPAGRVSGCGSRFGCGSRPRECSRGGGAILSSRIWRSAISWPSTSVRRVGRHWTTGIVASGPRSRAAGPDGGRASASCNRTPLSVGIAPHCDATGRGRAGGTVPVGRASPARFRH